MRKRNYANMRTTELVELYKRSQKEVDEAFNNPEIFHALPNHEQKRMRKMQENTLRMNKELMAREDLPRDLQKANEVSDTTGNHEESVKLELTQNSTLSLIIDEYLQNPIKDVYERKPTQELINIFVQMMRAIHEKYSDYDLWINQTGDEFRRIHSARDLGYWIWDILNTRNDFDPGAISEELTIHFNIPKYLETRPKVPPSAQEHIDDMRKRLREAEDSEKQAWRAFFYTLIFIIPALLLILL